VEPRRLLSRHLWQGQDSHHLENHRESSQTPPCNTPVTFFFFTDISRFRRRLVNTPYTTRPPIPCQLSRLVSRRRHPPHKCRTAYQALECPGLSIYLLLSLHLLTFQCQTGVCLETLTEHSETVTALAWLPNGTGFLSGALDGKVIHWVTISCTLQSHLWTYPFIECGRQITRFMGSHTHTRHRSRSHT